LRLARFDHSVGPDELRAIAAAAEGVEEQVAAILADVGQNGDEALARLSARFEHTEPGSDDLRVSDAELSRAKAAVGSDVVDALQTARENVRALCLAQLRPDTSVELRQGQRIEITQSPVRRAGAYIPGGRASYPSTVVMCAVTARAAGVEQICVCTPPAPDGTLPAAVLAACDICEVDEVFRVGGAHAVAALAYGTESVPAVDLIVGPGNPYVQEAKRQLAGYTGIDSIAGPSELVVVATQPAEARLIALDLAAQAEHGADSFLCLIACDDELIESCEHELAELTHTQGLSDARVAIVKARDSREAISLADALAPEHLQLVGGQAEALADQVRTAGCVFVGRDSATAFGDYVVGTNHVLPTAGSARFASALSVDTFTRRMAKVYVSAQSAHSLAKAGQALAECEGFFMHAESMRRRV
jgi:histidinol dehydrogenase